MANTNVKSIYIPDEDLIYWIWLKEQMKKEDKSISQKIIQMIKKYHLHKTNKNQEPNISDV